MVATRSTGSILNNVSIIVTIVDGTRAFVRGDRRTGALLLGAAALSRWVPGLGGLASVLVRILRRWR